MKSETKSDESFSKKELVDSAKSMLDAYTRTIDLCNELEAGGESGTTPPEAGKRKRHIFLKKHHKKQ
ncbi:MAG: hypothetical protein PHP76_07590 [Bacteroidales bacterium]|nr:hypothetical protein [Bacteroidales bacterium]